jgi:hypothetical protein
LDLEPSPSYSPLSSPSQSPRPPPSPPLGPSSDSEDSIDSLDTTTKLRDREREIRELKRKVEILTREKREAEERAAEKEKAAAVEKTTTTTTPTAATNLSELSADSIALRSTLRLLMLQRDRAKRDIHTLEQMREDALREPLEFVEFIQSQKRRDGKKQNLFVGRELPKPQEIYRCPPIEWSQYKILGAPLDAMHEKQRRRASPSQPAAAAGVPPSMQTGGIIGMPPEYVEDSGIMQGRMRLFDGIGQRGGVVGR